MKAPLLAIRRCAIALSLVHLAIFASYFIPYLADPQENLWQVLLPPWNSLFAFSHAPFAIIACIMFIPLLFPLLASWAAIKSPLRQVSLVSVRVSLPLIFVAWFFWIVLALELYAPASGLQSFLRLALFAPSVGLVPSLLLCLILARRLRRLVIQETALITSQSALAKERETAYADAYRSLPKSRAFIALTALGLLCQAVSLLSLFLPYTETYDPDKRAYFYTTGWQTLGLAFPFAAITVLLLMIPLLPYIASLFNGLALFFKASQPGIFQKGSVYLSYWLNLVGFILSSIIVEYSLLFIGADFNKETHWLNVAFGIPAAAFFCALLCSGILRGHVAGYAEVKPGLFS